MTDRHGNQKSRQWIGQFGERVASAYLRSQGAVILKRNFRAPRGGEVDVIARQGRLLLFVEVKTRQSDARIRPLDAVDAKKQQLIERGANAWLRKMGTREIPWRFDVIEVFVEQGCRPRVNWIKDAF